MRNLSARLRRLELARHAADNARPTPTEMRQAALTGQARPVVLDMLARMRAYGVELEAATKGFSPWPRA